MIAVRIGLALLVVLAVVPEVSRHAAERRLYHTSAMVRSVFAGSRERPEGGRVAAWAAANAAAAARDLPGDWRPLNLAGSAWLLAGHPEQALDRYREAMTLGERPEIDVNMGRAYARLGRQDRATTAFLRAGWISPAVLSWLPEAPRTALGSEIAELERRLRVGDLAAPPARPD